MSRSAGAPGREVEAMGALGAALAVGGDCTRGLRVLREGLAKALDLGDPVPIGMASSAWRARSTTATRSRNRSTSGSRARLGPVVCGSPGSTACPSKGCCHSEMARGGGHPRRHPARVGEGAQAPIGTPCSGGSSPSAPGAWPRRTRCSVARATLPASSPTRRMPATWPAASSSWPCPKDGSTTLGRWSTRVSTGWPGPRTFVSGRGPLRLAVSVEAEGCDDRPGTTRCRCREAYAGSLGLERLERLRELLALSDDGTSPVFDEARGNRDLAEAEGHPPHRPTRSGDMAGCRRGDSWRRVDRMSSRGVATARRRR